MTESTPADPELHLFSHVFTYDGKHLGVVKDSTSSYFKVQVRWGRDYWLNTALVRESGPSRVRLHVSHDSVDGYKAHELEPRDRSPARSSSAIGVNSSNGAEREDNNGQPTHFR